MDGRFNKRGFAANPSNAFMNLRNSIQIGGTGAEVVYCADTTLRLDSHGFANPFGAAPKGVKRKWSSMSGALNQQIESSLGLRLGNSSSSSDSKGSTATACASMSSAKETEEESSMDLELDFSLHLGGDKSSGSEKSPSSDSKSLNVWPEVDLQLSLSSGPATSDITTVHTSWIQPNNIFQIANCDGVLNADEVSTGNPYFPLITGQNVNNINFLNQSIEKAASPDLSSSVITAAKSSVTCTSGITQSQQQRSSSTKLCQFQGCLKGARGASGLCIAHGGGRRCQRLGCGKGAEGRTAFCKAHGGGRRCEFLGCTKSAEGRTDFCIAHGGGRRCSHDGCTRAARGKSGLCIRHGGGKRCQRENCTKSAEGLSGLCISHGGGRRCQYPECNKGAQGSTMFCKAHGGGKRCTYPECNKGAEGSTPFCKAHGGGKRCSFRGGGVCPKSVHGGTLYCVAHGGGKRCAVPDCTKSARGRTDFCVRHGGGKRCKYDGCGKSAQGSTDFCKAHGGGKRCSWGHPGYEFGQGDAPCNSFARSKTGLCASHGALVQDKRVHGGATIGTVVQDSKSHQPAQMKQILPTEDMNVDFMKMDNSTLTSANTWSNFGLRQALMPVGSSSSSGKVPEGRVHGGNLISMLAGNRGFNFSSNGDASGPSEAEKSFVTHQTWM